MTRKKPSYLKNCCCRDLQLPGTKMHCEFLSKITFFKHHKFNARQASETQVKRDLGCELNESKTRTISKGWYLHYVPKLLCSDSPTRKTNSLQVKLRYVVS